MRTLRCQWRWLFIDCRPLLGLVLLLVGIPRPLLAAPRARGQFLPDAEGSQIVTVARQGNAAVRITVLTEAVAVKETGPSQTVAKFGEVYNFAPAFIAVRRDQPTEITLWNLQPDDEHSFALLGAHLKVLMYLVLPPLTKTSFIFTFHRAGLFNFVCLQHQPEMAGQILVLSRSSH